MADQKEVDFIRKWIFPGGFLPTISYVVDSIRVGSKNALVVDSVSNIGVSHPQGVSPPGLTRSRTTRGRSGNGEGGSWRLSMTRSSQR